MPLPEPDRQFWAMATSSAAGLFIIQVLILVSVTAIFRSESAAVPPVAYVTTAAVSGALAAILWWKTTGVGRGIALAAATTAGMWTLSALFVFLTFHTAGSD
jgi:hypothetical protein